MRYWAFVVAMAVATGLASGKIGGWLICVLQ